MKQRLLLLYITVVAAGITARSQTQFNTDGTKVVGYLTDSHRNDRSLKKTTWKFEFGVVYETIPAITNTSSADGSLAYSTYDAISYPAASTAIQFWYNPARFVSLRLKPALTYGVAVGSGQTGYYLDYSGDAKLLLGTSVKLFAEAAYINRSGTYSVDQDAANASLGVSTSSGAVTSGAFAYSTTRLGGGLYFETSKRTDSYIELGAFRESTTLGTSGTADNASTLTTPIVYRATIVAGKFFFEGSYGSNYPLDGTPLYTLDANGVAQKSFLELKVGAVFTL
jgi:hypothetical protein